MTKSIGGGYTEHDINTYSMFFSLFKMEMKLRGKQVQVLRGPATVMEELFLIEPLRTFAELTGSFGKAETALSPEPGDLHGVGSFDGVSKEN